VRYQYMPPLSPEEYAELESSIRSHGVMVPILRNGDGVVIDGHHRLRIAESLGVACPAEYLVGRSESDLRTLAFELNLNRRHLTREQRRDLVVESIKADPQLSSREHGRRTGVDHKTAESVRASLSATGEIPQLDTRTGADGRTRVVPPAPPAPGPGPAATAGATPDHGDRRQDPYTQPAVRAQQKPRTDVVSTVNRALQRAQEAARAADEITRQHLAGRTSEASAWSRSLAASLESLQRLQGLLNGES